MDSCISTQGGSAVLQPWPGVPRACKPSFERRSLLGMHTLALHTVHSTRVSAHGDVSRDGAGRLPAFWLGECAHCHHVRSAHMSAVPVLTRSGRLHRVGLAECSADCRSRFPDVSPGRTCARPAAQPVTPWCRGNLYYPAFQQQQRYFIADQELTSQLTACRLCLKMPPWPLHAPHVTTCETLYMANELAGSGRTVLATVTDTTEVADALDVFFVLFSTCLVLVMQAGAPPNAGRLARSTVRAPQRDLND